MLKAVFAQGPKVTTHNYGPFIVGLARKRRPGRHVMYNFYLPSPFQFMSCPQPQGWAENFIARFFFMNGYTECSMSIQLFPSHDVA